MNNSPKAFYEGICTAESPVEIEAIIRCFIRNVGKCKVLRALRVLADNSGCNNGWKWFVLWAGQEAETVVAICGDEVIAEARIYLAY